MTSGRARDRTQPPGPRPAAIGSLVIERDDEQRLVLRQPGGFARVVFGSVGLGLAAVSWTFFPSLRVAPTLFSLFALWSFSGLLASHELVLDHRRRRWLYRHGWRFRPPLVEGSYDRLKTLSIEPHHAHDGLVASRLRSRCLWLEPDVGDRRFRLGAPMGPRAAEARAEQLANRLGAAIRRPADAPEA